MLNMKHFFFLIFFISTISFSSVHAAFLKDVPQTFVQPDGEVINCFASGDEFYHWIHDARGYTLVQNADDGYLYYGIREGEKVVPSKYRVNSVNPVSVNLQVGVKISPRLYQEKKDRFMIPLKSLKDAPTTGQVNNLVVYIAFADDSVITRPRSFYKPFFSAEDEPSMKDYFREVSYNRLFIDTYHYPESPDTINIDYIDENPRNYFLKKSSSNPEGYPASEGQGPREHALMKRAIEFVDSQIPDTLNIDMNDDGRVDNVCFVMQGGPAGWSDLLWPHRWSLYGETARINGKRVYDYLLMLEGALSSAAFGTGDKRAISDNTDPSCFLYNNGQGGRGGLDIFNISNAGDSITFDITIKPLYPPTQLVFTLGEGKVALDWYPSYVAGLRNYIVYRNGQKLASVTQSDYEDSTISEEGDYIYTVTAMYEGENNGESEHSNAVRVALLGVLELPYIEDFEKASHGWLIKGSVDGFRWGNSVGLEMNSNNETKFIGANSVAAGQNTHTIDYAISPRFNLGGLENVILEFDYAFKVWQRFDHLIVHYRRSETDNWVPFRELGQSGFGLNYVWRHLSLEIPQDAYTSEAQIAFKYSDSNEFAYGGAIDNVEVKVNTTSVESIDKTNGILVYPNPSSGKYEIFIDGINESEVVVKVISPDGREVWSASRTFSGSGRLDLDLSTQADGVYFLIIETENGILSKKLLKN